MMWLELVLYALMGALMLPGIYFAVRRVNSTSRRPWWSPLTYLCAVLVLGLTGLIVGYHTLDGIGILIGLMWLMVSAYGSGATVLAERYVEATLFGSACCGQIIGMMLEHAATAHFVY